jgi:hypothetical protein
MDRQQLDKVREFVAEGSGDQQDAAFLLAAFDELEKASEELVRVLTMEEDESFPALNGVKRALGWFDVPPEFASPAAQRRG